MLEDLYAVVHGERPVGVRAWCDDGALLMLLRLAGPMPFTGGQREHPGKLPYEAIPELVAAAVRLQTGCELAVGSWSVESDLGLVTFVFRLPPEPLAAADRAARSRRAAEPRRPSRREREAPDARRGPSSWRA